MPCRFASSGTVATSRSASRAILALNAASNFLRDLVISVLHRLRQSRTLHTLTFGPISGVHFKHPVSTVTSHVGRRQGLVVKHKVRDCPRHRAYQSGVRMGRQIVLQLGLEGSAQRPARLHAQGLPTPRLTTGSMDIGPMLRSTYSDSRSCSSKSLTSFWRRSVVTGSFPSNRKPRSPWTGARTFPKAAARLACSSLRSSSFRSL